MTQSFQRNTLLLEEADIASLIKEKIGTQNFLNQLRETLEEGFRRLAAKRVTVPLRHEFYFKEGALVSMSAADSEFFACKIVNTHCQNPSKFGIPTVLASGLLVDGNTGYPMLLTESTILTALRTGTVSAIATKYLAKKGSETIGIIGNGFEALPHLHAISLVRDIKRVYAYDIDVKASESFKKNAQKILKHLDVKTAKEPESMCAESDILVTVTCKGKNTPPVLLGGWVKDGTHVNAVGAAYPNHSELEKSLLERAKLVVDFKDQAIHGGEAQHVSREKIYADLADIVAKNKNSRLKDDEITIFDSVGFAMEDLQTYKLVYKLATNSKLGKTVNIAGRPNYCKDLYESYFLD